MLEKMHEEGHDFVPGTQPPRPQWHEERTIIVRTKIPVASGLRRLSHEYE
jgi:hypothetical protein